MSLFQVPRIFVQANNNTLRVGAVVGLDDRVPVEYLKENLCGMLAREMFKGGLVEFDVQDSDEGRSGQKLMRTYVDVVLPRGLRA